MSSTIVQTGMAIIGHHVTFGLMTDLPGAYKFHWMKDGALIGGAPSAKSYTTPPLSEADMKSKFSVRVYGVDQEVSNELTPAVMPKAAPKVEPAAEPEPEADEPKPVAKKGGK